jgi:NDP-sugar pyrophosphorylase family protein
VIHLLPVAILAGGLALRLRPLTEKVPKALIDIAGTPFIAHQLRLLRERGIGRVVLCLGYLGDSVREFVGDGGRFGLHADYSFDGPAPLGTAGAIRQALPLLGDAFFVLYGDSYLPCDYAAVERAFQQSGKSALMTVYHNQDRWDKSNIEFDDGKILAYDKTRRSPKMQYIDYGLAAFRGSAFDRSFADMMPLYQALLSAGDLAAFEVRERFYEIGSVEGIRKLSEYLKS